MADEIDESDVKEQLLKDVAVGNISHAAAKLNVHSGVTECVTCGDSIAERVRAIPAATECVECIDYKARRK